MNFRAFSALVPLIAVPLALSVPTTARAADATCGISIVDDATGRGVPLVELRTTNDIRFYTDSAGAAAIPDPDLLGQNVFFRISSPGYRFAADGFGFQGIAVKLTPGGRATLRIKRENIAERLYRITGSGIYRDSVMLGQTTPLREPLVNALVVGQDTVLAVLYRGKLYWFWGDTSRPSYPLGQFATSGATSLLPGAGGLSPDRGIDFTYWVDGDGFSRPMIPLAKAAGPVWVGGTFTLLVDGTERLFTHFAEVDHAMKPTRSGLAQFNDAKATFEPIHFYDAGEPLHPNGHPFHAIENGRHYLYFSPTAMGAFPIVRALADLPHLTDPKSYESYTCLAPGARFAGSNTLIEHGPEGHALWAWKANTPALGMNEIDELVEKRLLPTDETLTPLRDVLTGKKVLSHGGSVYWNAYRRRWVMITTQAFGDPSYLGEVWFAEADTPTGPWVYARKIATHGHYTFYNPTQHPFFDQDGGRTIYFEGTYTDTFSDVKDITPRYNYNQLMYRVDLADPRLALPAPVYRLASAAGGPEYALGEAVAAENGWKRVAAAPFFAVPPDRAHGALIPVYGGDRTNGPALFYALPPTPADGEKVSPDIVPLYAWHDSATGRRYLTTDADVAPVVGAKRAAQPIARVWRNPTRVLALDGDAVSE